MLKQAVDHFGLSARAHVRILKLARTGADLEVRADIAQQDLMFAINCRVIDRRNWLGSIASEPPVEARRAQAAPTR